MKTMKLYTNTWCNTAMSNQPTWVFETERPNGCLGERIGQYCGISADRRRIYTLGNDYVWFGDYGYYPKADEEAGLTTDGLCRQFVEDCEGVFCRRRVVVWHEDIAKAMMTMSEQLGLGWVMIEDRDYDTYEDCWRIYSADFVKKAHIGENVTFCFSEESVEEVLTEVPFSMCNYVMEEVIMEYPDGSYDEDMAYVVYLPENA